MNAAQTVRRARAVADSVTSYALNALLFELSVTPKPGLVDRRNAGAHKDMDYALFLVSARAIAPHIGACAGVGYITAHLPAADAFARVRMRGLRAQRDMLSATGGVNTHKGAIFCLGLLAAAYGRLIASWDARFALPKGEALTALVCEEAARLSEDTLSRELADIKARACVTNGERAYLECGLSGARGEAISGYASVRALALPALRAVRTRSLRAQGGDENGAALVALAKLIAEGRDTCLYARGGAEGLAFAQCAARALLAKGAPNLRDFARLDDAFVSRGLSPGGCADLLCVARFLYTLETEGEV